MRLALAFYCVRTKDRMTDQIPHGRAGQFAPSLLGVVEVIMKKQKSLLWGHEIIRAGEKLLLESEAARYRRRKKKRFVCGCLAGRNEKDMAK